MVSSNVFGLFLDNSTGNSAISLNATGLSMGVFEQAVANIAYLRAQTGGGMSRLNFAADSLASMETNMRAAIGRVEDVDIAAESANLAKYSILTQASAAMVAQANTTNDVALMLLRIREKLICKRKSHESNEKRSRQDVARLVERDHG